MNRGPKYLDIVVGWIDDEPVISRCIDPLWRLQKQVDTEAMFELMYREMSEQAPWWRRALTYVREALMSPLVVTTGATIGFCLGWWWVYG